jgi:glycosyltransferase involved in cell wall biosynthesis
MRITGRAKLSNEARQRLPSNVQLTGYLSEEAYIAMLGSADAIVDLTTREDCLVCGAYEALALARPLVVSDTTALRGLLQRAALYTRNFSSDIAAAARLALEQGVMLQREADARSLELREDWRSRKTQLLDHLARLNATR